MVWTTSFDPPPQKGPPPKIPLPKTPTAAELQRGSSVSPSSNPPGNEYFNKVNFSPTSPPRVPPKMNIRAPVLHRLSETESIEEGVFDPIAGPRFRGPTSDSPVSPYTVVGHDTSLPVPTAFDLDKSGRKGSASSGGTIPQSRPSRVKSLPFVDDEEPTPFVMKSDKHKRILGIDPKPAAIKRQLQKNDNSAPPSSNGIRRKRSLPDVNARANSPLPAPDVVPFLYQDIEVCAFPTD
jgi:hypothetical protein